MKYIDAEKLIAKIAELRKELPNTIEHLNDEESGFARGQQYELTAIEAEILCLQQEQPEVDIKKEIDELWKSLNTGHEYVVVDSYQDFLGICLHCFELGKSARKESEDKRLRSEYEKGYEQAKKDLREEVASCKAKFWQDGYEDGVEWIAGQGVELTGTVHVNGMGRAYIPPEYIYLSDMDLKEGDKVIVQIRKK